MKRYWIDQPSTLQPDHRIHGVNVLGPSDLKTAGREVEHDRIVQVWHISGPIISEEVFASSLSEGWFEKT